MNSPKATTRESRKWRDRVAESIFVVVDGGGEWLYSKYLVRFDHFGRYDTRPGGFKQVPTSAAAQDYRLRV